MAGDQPLGNMVIGISMEGTQFANTLKEIKGQVKQAQSAMKANLAVLSDSGDEYNSLKAKVSGLTDVMAANKREIDALRKKHQEAINTYGAGSEQVSKLAKQVNNAITKQSAWGRQLDQTKTKLASMNSPMGQFSSKLNEISDKAKSVGSKVKDMADGISQTFAPAAVVTGAGLGIATKKAMDFEAEISNVKSVMDPDDVKKYGSSLHDLAITMGAKTKYSATEAAQGIEELVKAGVKTTDIIHGGLSGALNLATAGELSLKDAAEIASTALNSFKDDNISVTQAANILAGAANASATDVGELKYSLSAVSAVASGVGMSFKDTSTALAVMAQNGLKGSDAGTSLKTMLLNLSPSTNAAANMMAQLGLATKNTSAAYQWLVDRGIKPASHSSKDVSAGLQKLAQIQAGSGASAAKVAKEYQTLAKNSGYASSAFYDQNGKLKDLSQISGLLHDRLKNLTDEQRQYALKVMFGTDAVRASNIMFKEGSKGVKDMANAMGKIKASDVAKQKMDNLKGSIEQLKGSLETAGITIGEALTPAIKGLTSFVQHLVDGFNSLPKPVQKATAIIAAIIATMLIAVTSIGFLTSGISNLIIAYGTLTGGMSAVTAGIAAEGAAATSAGASTGLLAGAIGLLTSPVTIAIGAVVALVAGFVLAYKKIKPFHDLVNNIILAIKKFTSGIIQMFQGNWVGGATILEKLGLSDATVQKIIITVTRVKSIYTSMRNTISSVFSVISGSVKKGMSYVSQSIGSGLKSVSAWWKNTWPQLKIVLSSFFKTTKAIITVSLLPLFVLISSYLGALKNSWKNIWHAMTSTLKLTFDVFKTTLKVGFDFISGIFSVFMDILSGNWKKAWLDLKKTGLNILKDLWNGLKSIGGDFIDIFKNIGLGIANGLVGGIVSGVNAIGKGINWILDKVHAPKKYRIGTLKIPHFANGTDNHEGGLAVVSDGKGKNKQELITLPNGQSFLSPTRETVMNLPKGTSVLNADATAQLLDMAPKYASGKGWLQNAWDSVKSVGSKLVNGTKSVAKKAVSKVADVSKDIWDYASDPKKLLNLAINKFTDLSNLAGPTLGIVKGTMQTVEKGAVNWIKSLLEADNPPGSGVSRWAPYVKRALEANGLSTSKSMVDKVLRQIQTESGGDPKAVQHGYTDVNTINGDLAKGLMQTISSTFNAYKFPGHNNIFNGYDNLLAALNYAKTKYGKSLSALGQGHGYANGGFVLNEQIARVAEGNKPEAIIPLDRLKRTRALQLLSKTQKALGVDDQSQTTSDKSNSDTMNKLLTATEQSNTLLQQLINLIANKDPNVYLDGKQMYENNKKYEKQETNLRNFFKGVAPIG